MITLDELLKVESRATVALVRAEHEESLLSAAKAIREDLADFIFIGDEKLIRKKAKNLGIPRDGYSIRHVESDREAAELGARLAAESTADVLMKGMLHTAVFTKALLNKDLALIPERGLLSQVGLFELPGLPEPVALTDAGLNIAPGLEQKKQILANALSICRKLGKSPVRTACVAPVEEVKEKIPSTKDAADLAAMDWEDAIVEGPLALDAVLSAEAAKTKGIKSRVAGRPDLLLMPGLDAANAVYKAFGFIPGSRSAGTLAGLKIPVILTSRSDSEEIRYLSLKLALAVSDQ